MGGQSRGPCPGMGKLPSRVIKKAPGPRMTGRCICPECQREVAYNSSGLVGYHTSDHSAPKEAMK